MTPYVRMLLSRFSLRYYGRSAPSAQFGGYHYYDRHQPGGTVTYEQARKTFPDTIANAQGYTGFLYSGAAGAHFARDPLYGQARPNQNPTPTPPDVAAAPQPEEKTTVEN